MSRSGPIAAASTAHLYTRIIDLTWLDSAAGDTSSHTYTLHVHAKLSAEGHWKYHLALGLARFVHVPESDSVLVRLWILFLTACQATLTAAVWLVVRQPVVHISVYKSYIFSYMDFLGRLFFLAFIGSRTVQRQTENEERETCKKGPQLGVEPGKWLCGIWGRSLHFYCPYSYVISATATPSMEGALCSYSLKGVKPLN